ncbi:MAG: RluA family pseudouridine synthase [Planctomycetes bacterium]|nr:RluA family pseudouridine synthase [Planctomycetota bacterium]
MIWTNSSTAPPIPGEWAGPRRAQPLAREITGFSRADFKKLFDHSEVMIAGSVVKPSYKLKGGELVEIHVPAPEPLAAEAENIPLDILYEDDDIVVLNKRPGIVTHPSQGHRTGTLVNALLHHYADSLSGIGGVIRPGIVHRLDMDTSGCLVAAKNDPAHAGLMEQFMTREVEKVYLAITEGSPRPLSGTVEGNIGRSVRNRKLHTMLKSGGRRSLTRYTTLENYGAIAMVECRLETGRTHQARVHLAHVGSPVLCDKDYGRREVFTEGEVSRALSLYRHGEARGVFPPGEVVLGRQALHAARLAFRHPCRGGRLSFEAPLPADMARVLAPFRQARDEMTAGQ